MRDNPWYARGLQVIRVSPDRFVLKRGLCEVSIAGAVAAAIVEPLAAMLDGTRGRAEILEAFSGDLRPDVDRLLRALQERGLAGDRAEDAAGAEAADGSQSAFYDNFGPAGRAAPDQLRQAVVLVAGANLTARALALGLLECGVGQVIVVDHPVLTNPAASGWARRDGSPGDLPREAAGRLCFSASMPGDETLRGVSLLCATSDLGEVDALLEMSRLALRLERPFLPAWLDGMMGVVGPLCYARETACLRCYRLRADASSPRYDVARAVRKHLSIDPEARAATGLLPPMPGVLGRVAAMEALKCLGGFIASDTIGQILEINLIAFGATSRRVLKIPRCPDCSEQSRRAPTALTHGPQIPDRR